MKVIAVEDSHQYDFVEYNDAHFSWVDDNGEVHGWFRSYEEAERAMNASIVVESDYFER